MNTLPIKKEILRWARLRAGFELADLIKPFPKLAEWENGDSLPTLKQLEGLAKKLLAPLGYFFLPEPPEEKLPINDFRSISDTPIRHPSPDLLETVFSMQRRQAWLREFVIEEGAEPLPFVGSVTMRDNPEKVAQSIRAVLGLNADWAISLAKWSDAFSSLWLHAERAGIVVVCNGIVGNNTSRILDVEEFRGFVLSDPYVPLVFINNADAKAAQMFTLAHEFAHLWIGSAGVLNFKEMNPANNATELFCNAVAAEMLVPHREIMSAWQDRISIYELASYFKVSPLVIGRRLLDLGKITRDDFFKFYNTYVSKVRIEKNAREGGGNFYSNCDYRIGRPFAGAIGRAVKSGRLLYRDAYKLTGLQGKTFDKYVMKISGEG